MILKSIARSVLSIAIASAIYMATPAAVLAQADDEKSSTGTGQSDSGGGFFKKIFGGGAGTETTVTSPSDGPSIDEAQQEAYDGPKARIAVARFTDKTGKGWYTGGIGDGMADQLTTALFNSSRYIVLERQILSDVLQEQDLGASGRIRQGTAAPIGEIEGAELLITGAVTEFEGQASGGGGGAAGSGLFGTAGRLIGSIASAHSTAHMAIDVRIIDTRTSRIVAATSVEGKATDVNMGVALLGSSGGAALGGSLGAWKNTPIEKALRQCIQAAVDFVVSKTPKVYYRHGASARQASAPAASAPTAQPSRNTPDYLPGMVARVSSRSANVRQGPGTGNPVVFSASQGTPLLVLETQKDWIQVRDQAQRVGWTAAWLTLPDSSVSPEIFEPGAAGAAATAPAQAIPAQATPAQATPAAAAAAPVGKTADPNDPIARLKRLDTLLQQGIISEDEHKTLRQKVLDEL